MSKIEWTDRHCPHCKNQLAVGECLGKCIRCSMVACGFCGAIHEAHADVLCIGVPVENEFPEIYINTCKPMSKEARRVIGEMVKQVVKKEVFWTAGNGMNTLQSGA